MRQADTILGAGALAALLTLSISLLISCECTSSVSFFVDQTARRLKGVIR
jgi:hypothetical protein